MRLAILAALALALPPLALAAQTPMQHDDGMAMDHNKPPVPPSKAVTVTYAGKSVTLTMGDLLNLPQITVHVHNAHRNTDETYSGPLVSDVVAKAGLVARHDSEPTILHSTLVATGTDHYFVVYSMAETQPSFSTGKVIVAVMKSGLPDSEGGMIQLINTDAAKPARWVHGLSDLNVMTLAASK